MENQTSSSPVSPIPNENDSNSSSSSTPGHEFKTVLDMLMEKNTENVKMELQLDQMKTRIAQLEESLKKSQQSEAASNAEISKLSKIVQDSQTKAQTSCNRINQAGGENTKILQSRMCTVADLIVDGIIDYEQLKYKILMLNNLVNDGEKWLADGIEFSPEYSDFQICVTRKFEIKRSYLSPMLSHVLYSNILELSLDDSTILYSDYIKLISSPNLKKWRIWESNIIDKSGNIMEVGDLLKAVPDIKIFSYWFSDGEITSETSQKLSQLPLFASLLTVCLCNIQEDFDLKAFGEFIKQNPKASYILKFKSSSESFAKIKSIEKELIPTLPSTCKLEIERDV